MQRFAATLTEIGAAASDDKLVINFETRKSDQTEGVTFHCPKILFGLITFHCTEFQQPPSKEQGMPGAITLMFKDGIEAQCDVLIGSDGRQALDRPMNYTGKNKHVISYPIMKGKFINVVVFVSQPEKEGSSFDHPWPRYNSSFSARTSLCAGKFTRLRNSQFLLIIMLRSLAMQGHDRRWIHSGRTPSLLAHSRTTLYTLPVALKVYESVCLRHANEVQRCFRLQGKMYEFADPQSSFLAGRVISDGAEDREDAIKLMMALGDAIFNNKKWAWETIADDEGRNFFRGTINILI
ncbi:hypothetical protein ACEPAI_9836 [Sanghuangporus weigelae]